MPVQLCFLCWQSVIVPILHVHPPGLQARQEAEADRLDDIAEGYGVSDFSYRLHKALEAEGEQSAAMIRRPRWGSNTRSEGEMLSACGLSYRE